MEKRGVMNGVMDEMQIQSGCIVDDGVWSFRCEAPSERTTQ